jgi:hypothetical protein
MPNRGQTQDQRQKGQQNPGTFSPDDDEALEADQTQLGAESELEQQDQQPGRKRRAVQNTDDQSMVEDIDAEEDEDDEDEEEGSGNTM